MTLTTESQAWVYLAERVATAKEDDGLYGFVTVPRTDAWKDFGLCMAALTLRERGMISDETCILMRGRLRELPRIDGSCFCWPTNTADGVRSRVRFCTEMAELASGICVGGGQRDLSE